MVRLSSIFRRLAVRRPAHSGLILSRLVLLAVCTSALLPVGQIGQHASSLAARYHLRSRTSQFFQRATPSTSYRPTITSPRWPHAAAFGGANLIQPTSASCATHPQGVLQPATLSPDALQLKTRVLPASPERPALGGSGR